MFRPLSGWYIPDYTFGQPLRYAQNAGCSFASYDQCAANPLAATSSPWLCTPGTTPATFSFTVSGVQKTASLTDSCSYDATVVSTCSSCSSTTSGVCVGVGCGYLAQKYNNSE